MSQWERIELEQSEDMIDLLAGRPPIELWKREFNTREEPEEWKDFIYNPLQALMEAGVISGNEQSGEGRGWRVSTHIINHHKPLNPRIGIAMATVDSSEEEVGVTVYKVEEAY